MTIYMVQHVFSRPEWEEEWNAWYAANLNVLLGVQGFRTGQRFKALEGSPPRYMAVYTVDSPEVFESRVYRDAGGGGTNSQRFRPAYQVWIRNLFEGIAAAPEVRSDEYLVSLDSATKDHELRDVPLTWLETTGFHKSTPYRGIAVVKPHQLELLRGRPDVTVYQPITGQQGPLYDDARQVR
jgi:hypothetical protein